MNVCRLCKYGYLLYQSRDHYIGGSLTNYGEYSDGEVDLFRALVKPADTVVEVGSNVGALTVPLAYLAKEVYAFEPQKDLSLLLAANCALTNRTVHVYPYAVSDVVGEIKIPVVDYDAEFVNGGGLEILKDYEGVGKESKAPTHVVTIDSLNLPACDFLKADVEGMEEKVLRGAANTIARCRPLFYLEDDRPDNRQSLHDYVRSLGYDIYPHSIPLFNPNNFHGNPNNVFGNLVSIMILCWPRERPLSDRISLQPI